MAKKTYIPAILKAFEYLKRYVNTHSDTLKQRLGNSGYALIVLVIDLAMIAAEIIDTVREGDESWQDFTPIVDLSSSDINNISGAIGKFYTAIGEEND